MSSWPASSRLTTRRRRAGTRPRDEAVAAARRARAGCRRRHRVDALEQGPAGGEARPPDHRGRRAGAREGGRAVGDPHQQPRHLGDIVIAYETAAAEARAERKPFDHHLAHLAVHGFLHLLGYDHESDSEAEAMERCERMILSRLGVPDPYAARAADD